MTQSAKHPAIAILTRPIVGRLGLAELSVLALIGLFLALIGAFDSDQIDLHRRLAYWIFVLVAGGACGGAIEPWLERWPPLATRPWLRAPVLILAMAAPSTVIVMFTAVALYSGHASFKSLVRLYPQVTIICIPLVAMAWTARRALRPAAPAPTPSEAAPPPLLRDKLPPRLARARLLAVQAEDHYLRVHTDAGDALLLMRFTDALEALEAMDGVRTHRSWWVARSAVEEALWRRGRGDLVLVGGLTAPVSRGYAAAVRAIDWA